jgi:HK97 family phage prohead protease
MSGRAPRGIGNRDIEKRGITSPIELREDGSRRIGGMGVVYGKRSRLLPGGFFEVVENRALSKGIGDGFPGVVSRLEHHPEWLLGTTDAKTMSLRNNPDVGLDYEVDLPDTTAGNDAYVLIKRGDLRSASMGFQDYGSEWSHDGSIAVRHLVSIRLTEISPVSQPAYVQTNTALRGLAAQVGEDPDDVFELARQNELRRLFPGRTDIAALPEGLVVAQRNGAVPQGMSWQKARLAMRARDMAMDRRPTPQELTLKLRQRRIQWDDQISKDRTAQWH